MSDTHNRQLLLSQVMRADMGFQQAIKKLYEFDWDYEDAPVLLSVAVIKSILQRFLSGDLSDRDVYVWADALELREDVQEENESVSYALHALANPDLEGALTPLFAKQILEKLA